MPTGYTAGVADGTIKTLRQYALDCARAFGACVMLRDEGGGGERIPQEFVASDYHSTKLAEESERLCEIRELDSAEAEARAAAQFAEQLADHRRRLERDAEQRARYDSMIARVLAWNAPTSDHVALRDFMLKQLHDSKAFDCRDPNDRQDSPVRLTGEQWRAEQLKQVGRSIQYHAEENENEIKRTDERNAWIKALRESLPNGTESA
jgi:hypothetical protein